MSDPPPPSRGRARARVRGAAPQFQLVATVAEGDQQLMEPPTPDQSHMQSHMYGGSGNVSGVGTRSGTSSGNEAEGGSSGGSAPTRGSPRGGQVSSGRRPGFPSVDPEFIRTRPAAFDKKGSSGRALQIVSNYYEFRMNKGYKLGLYAVAVTVQPPSDEIDDKKIRALVKTRKDQLGSYLLSGSQLMTTHPIPEELLQPFQVVLPNPDGNEGVVPTYTVTISYLREVQEHEGFVIQFYNVIVRTVQGILKYAQVGRHYYDPKAAVKFNSWRLELWPGFINSIRAQDGGLYLNIESCWKVLSTQNIYEKMLEIRAQDRENFQENCSKAIVGTMVVTPYNPKAYKIVRIDFNANCSNTFETSKGRTSFTDYFWTKYKQQVRHPNQPMLVSEPTRKEQRRGMIGDVYLVPELCFPAGLNDELRANFRLMKELASCLHMDPTNRLKTTQDFMNSIQSSADVQTALAAWGVGFNRAPVEVAARQIPPEKLLFKNDTFQLDDKADWTMAFRSKQMYSPAVLRQWAIIVTNRDAQGVNNLISTMQRVAGPIGYTISQPMAIVRAASPSASAFTNALNEVIAKAQGKLDMILIILPNPNADTYAAVKKICSISHGSKSLCIFEFMYIY
ncbi:unnamed protein product [Orchesella dallaii]|uniref:PAZ domain-containing protein n=1 Tax=Orchesella dallaii TaxID=48710 RepID=A0ABP1PMS1_9HEXA